jgi:hypothetical protein
MLEHLFHRGSFWVKDRSRIVDIGRKFGWLLPIFSDLGNQSFSA